MRSTVVAFASLACLVALSGCLVDPHGDSCFTGDTPVATPQGPRPIASLAVGDEVYAFRPETHEVTVRRVTHIHRAEVDVVLDVDTGSVTLTTTDNHPFWDAEQRTFRPAADLHDGDVLARLEGDAAMVPARVTRVRRRRAPGTPVWNITVDGEHTYFAAGIAVHNKLPRCDNPCGPDVPAPSSLRNDSRTPVTITLRALPEGLSVRAGLLEDSVGQAILARALAAAPATRELSIPAGQSAEIPRGTLGEGESPREAALLTLNGSTTWLLLDKASARIVEGGTGPTLEASYPVGKVVPLVDILPVCSAPAPAPAKGPRPSVTWTYAGAKPFGSRFTIADQRHDATLGWTVGLEDEKGALATLAFPGPEAVWPGKVGESLEADVQQAGDGLSVQLRWSAEGAGVPSVLAFQLQDTRPAKLPSFPNYQGELLSVTEDTSCVPATTTCASTRLPLRVVVEAGNRPVTDTTPFVTTSASAVASTYVLEATGAPVSAACDPATSHLVFATVVRAP